MLLLNGKKTKTFLCFVLHLLRNQLNLHQLTNNQFNWKVNLPHVDINRIKWNKLKNLFDFQSLKIKRKFKWPRSKHKSGFLWKLLSKYSYLWLLFLTLSKDFGVLKNGGSLLKMWKSFNQSRWSSLWSHLNCFI